SEAARDANTFLNEPSKGHDDQHPYTPGDLATLAKTRHLTVKTTEPFDLKSGSKDLALSPKYLHILFSLRDDEPDDKERSELYASPLVGDEAVYVAGLAR